MNNQHPVLKNILTLAETTTWQHSLEVGSKSLHKWAFQSGRREVARVFLVGCGTSYCAAKVGKHIIEQIAHIPTRDEQAFAFATYHVKSLLNASTLVVGISTTGESEAVRDALALASQAGAQTLAMTAKSNSTVAGIADHVILTGGEADQVSVKTASYNQSLISLYLLACALAQTSLSTDSELADHWQGQITEAAGGVKRWLDQCQAQVQNLAAIYAKASKFFLMSSGPNLGTAQEAALKIVEMAKVFSDAYELEDFLHGRIRELDGSTPVFFVAPQGRVSRRTLDFLSVTQRIDVPSMVLTDQVTPALERLATHILPLPVDLDELATPLTFITPLHLFAYYLATERNWDPLSRRYEGFIPQRVHYEEAAT